MPQLFSNEAINAFKALKHGVAVGLREWGNIYTAMRDVADAALSRQWRQAASRMGAGAKSVFGNIAAAAYRDPQRLLGTTSRLARLGYFAGFSLPIYGIGATIHRYSRGGTLFYDEYGRPDVSFLPFF